MENVAGGAWERREKCTSFDGKVHEKVSNQKTEA
jgi:hypothetical protein